MWLQEKWAKGTRARRQSWESKGLETLDPVVLFFIPRDKEMFSVRKKCIFIEFPESSYLKNLFSISDFFFCFMKH